MAQCGDGKSVKDRRTSGVVLTFGSCGKSCPRLMSRGDFCILCCFLKSLSDKSP